MYVLRTFIEQNQDGSGLGRMAFLMTTITDELTEELAEHDELAIRAFMFQIGEVISWIGHGDNERLPEAVRPFAETIQPSEPMERPDADAEDQSALAIDNREDASVVSRMDE